MANETKAARFKRLAERRSDAILDGIRKLANLANSHLYEFTPEQIERMFKTIERRVDLARGRFEAEFEFGRNSRENFTL